VSFLILYRTKYVNEKYYKNLWTSLNWTKPLMQFLKCTLPLLLTICSLPESEHFKHWRQLFNPLRTGTANLETFPVVRLIINWAESSYASDKEKVLPWGFRFLEKTATQTRTPTKTNSDSGREQMVRSNGRVHFKNCIRGFVQL